MICCVPTFQMVINEPTIEPYLTHEIEGVGNVNPLRTQLIAATSAQRQMPGIARSLECEDPGFTWVFNVRENACFINAESVDSRGFPWGAARTPDPGALAAQRAGAR